MGASESFPATPTCTPLLNKHLKNVRDPRSPTAGILRTPIEVESSPKDNTQFPKQGELVAESQHENWDPRSPTPGISRTPLKDVLADAINYPVKLFCENFMGENSEEELPQNESQHQDQKSEFTSGMEERTARSTVSSGEIFLEDSQQAEGENKQLFSMVSVAAATKPVQSPLQIHSSFHTASSVPNFQETVPRASCCSHAICSYSQTAHPIIVSRQKACRFK
uniref:Uncharacterized protein n=1 Tax=Pseudonaja textilis TaxID=8673 RepID=A0A670ZFG1_PSETE